MRKIKAATKNAYTLKIKRYRTEGHPILSYGSKGTCLLGSSAFLEVACEASGLAASASREELVHERLALQRPPVVCQAVEQPRPIRHHEPHPPLQPANDAQHAALVATCEHRALGEELAEGLAAKLSPQQRQTRAVPCQQRRIVLQSLVDDAVHGRDLIHDPGALVIVHLGVRELQEVEVQMAQRLNQDAQQRNEHVLLPVHGQLLRPS